MILRRKTAGGTATWKRQEYGRKLTMFLYPYFFSSTCSPDLPFNTFTQFMTKIFYLSYSQLTAFICYILHISSKRSYSGMHSLMRSGWQGVTSTPRSVGELTLIRPKIDSYVTINSVVYYTFSYYIFLKYILCSMNSHTYSYELYINVKVHIFYYRLVIFVMYKICM